MTGLRSARRLETACREQLALQWLSGYQQPDHNTLWRFYQQHRNQLRGLLRHTVQIAARLGLVDWALQAVDGTKVAGSASSSRTYDAQQLERLLERTERAIADLEAQNEAGDEPAAARLPTDLAEAQRLRAEVLAARQALAAGERRHVNLTDPDARLLRTAGGYLTGYNAQAVAVTVRYEAGAAGQVEDAVSAGNDEHAGDGENTGDEDSENRSSKGEDVGNVGNEDEAGEGDQEPGEDRSGREADEAGGADGARTRSGGLLITAADVTQDPTDQAQLLPMIEAAEQSGGPAAGLTLADAGYFSAANLAACAASTRTTSTPPSQHGPPAKTPPRLPSASSLSASRPRSSRTPRTCATTTATSLNAASTSTSTTPKPVSPSTTAQSSSCTAPPANSPPPPPSSASTPSPSPPSCSTTPPKKQPTSPPPASSARNALNICMWRRVGTTAVVAPGVPSPDRGEIPLDLSQYRPLRGRCRSLPLRRQGAEGENVALSRRRCGPPPQSLRDSSPSGGAMESQIPLTTQCGQRGPALVVAHSLPGSTQPLHPEGSATRRTRSPGCAPGMGPPA